MLAELKQCFMEAYDDNQDGKIEIREVSSKHCFIILLYFALVVVIVAVVVVIVVVVAVVVVIVVVFGLSQRTSSHFIPIHGTGFRKPTVPQYPPSHF